MFFIFNKETLNQVLQQVKPSNMTKNTKYESQKPRGRRSGQGNKSRTKQDKYFKPSPRQAFTKFKGNTPELDGFIFDWSDNKQADRYVTAMKRIAEHIGTNYHNGGDICSTIEQGKRFDIPKPIAPSTTNNEVDKIILTKKVNSYVRRDSILDETSIRDIPLCWVNAQNYSSPKSIIPRTGITSP